MRYYGGDIHFVRLEVHVLANKQFSFSLFYYAISPWTLFKHLL